MSSDKDEEKIEHLKFKIVFLGDAAVGKTSLARQLAHLEVQTQYQPTSGVEFYKAETVLAGGVHVSVQLWDIGSQVKSLDMAANYLHNCDAALVVYDVMQRETYNVACEWIQVLQQMFQASGLPLMALVANKADTGQLQALAAEIQPGPTNDVCDGGICRYCVSAHTGANVQAMLTSICSQLAGVPEQQQQQQDSPAAATKQHEQHTTGEKDQKPTKARAPRLLQTCCWPLTICRCLGRG